METTRLRGDSAAVTVPVPLVEIFGLAAGLERAGKPASWRRRTG